MARHLILGGTGFVGRHIARGLLDDGDAVTVTSRETRKLESISRLMPALGLMQLEMRTANWMEALAGFDVIHHYSWSSIPQTAAEDPIADVDCHIKPTLALLEAAKKLGSKRVLFLSSGGTVYGSLADGLASENDYPKPLTIYGATKLAVENYLRVYHVSGDVECLVGRLSNPYGLGQSLDRNQGLVTTFVMKALAGESLSIWGDGNVVRDYIHISDVTLALIALARLPSSSLSADLPVFNVASGVGLSVNQVVQIIERQVGRPLDVTRMPGRRIDLPVSVLNTESTAKALGWSARLSLEQGVQRMIDEHRSNRSKSAASVGG